MTQLRLPFFVTAGVLFALLAASGCSHSPGVAPIGTADLPQNPSDAIAMVESRLEKATLEDDHVLAPSSFEQSRQHLIDAKKSLQNSDGDAAFKHAAEANTELNRTQSLAHVARTTLPDLIAARKKALEAEQAALKENSAGFETVQKQAKNSENHFRSLTASLENNDVNRVNQEKPAMLAEYLTLEESALKKENLGTAKRWIEKAKFYEAGKYAPKSLADAETAVKLTEAFIEKNPENREEIKARSDAAIFSARRAVHIAQESRKFADKKPEDIALWTEAKFAQIGKSLDQADLRDQSFVDQVAALEQKATTLRGQETGLEKTIARTQSAADMENRVANLKSVFTDDEAEILRKDDQVVIRLRQMNFVSGRASLTEKQLGLLSKVKEAVERFPGAKVTVEGHTDSTGTPELNRRLSEKRADAVRTYLVENANVPEAQVIAEGKGAEEPLTTNGTREGRAENRRIDILIEPTTPTLAE